MSEMDILFPIPDGRRNADDMGMPPGNVRIELSAQRQLEERNKANLELAEQNEKLKAELAAARATITEMEAGYGRAARMIVGLKADLAAALEEIKRYKWERTAKTDITLEGNKDFDI